MVIRSTFAPRRLPGLASARSAGRLQAAAVATMVSAPQAQHAFEVITRLILAEYVKSAGTYGGPHSTA